MCLTKITNWYKEDSGVGYKVFIVRGNELFPFVGKKRAFKENEWMKSRKKVVKTTDKKHNYEVGYHLFTNEDDAHYFAGCWELICRDEARKHLEFVVKKVLFRNVLCSGCIKMLFAELETVVVKELYIPSEKGVVNESNS